MFPNLWNMFLFLFSFCEKMYVSFSNIQEGRLSIIHIAGPEPSFHANKWHTYHTFHRTYHHSYYTFQLIKHIITHMNLGIIHITHIGEPALISISMNIVIPPSLPFLRQFSILYHILSLFAVGLNGLARPEQCQYHKNRTGSNDQWSKPSFSEWI